MAKRRLRLAGQCFDNSLAESLFATLQCELLDRQRWQTRAELATANFDYVERFYNPTRRHSGLGYRSPIEFETIAVIDEAPAA